MAASITVAFVIVFAKSAPAWYGAAFVAAASYLVLAGSFSIYLRRTRRQVTERDKWLAALSSGRIGIFVLVAVCVVFGALLLVARAR